MARTFLNHYPNTLDDLVAKNYLRRIPPDPIIDSDKEWVTMPPKDSQKGVVFDVKSGALGNGKDGTPYANW